MTIPPVCRPLRSPSRVLTALLLSPRDPRWGRGQETPGEDPYLSSEYVYYLIRGYQEGEDARYYKIVADCKHYAGYDVEDWHGHERYGYDARISMQDLVETYLPSFKSCLKDAKVGSAMCRSPTPSLPPSFQRPPCDPPHHSAHSLPPFALCLPSL